MMRLILTEMNRFRSRRFALIALIAVVALLGLFQVVTYQSMKPPTEAQIAEAQRYFDQAKADYEDNLADYEQQEQDCLDQGNPPDVCHFEPQLDQYLPTAATFEDTAPLAVMLAVVLAGLAFLFVSASFIGGEYSSGSISNWLSFIPQRGKVFFSKLLGLSIPAAIAGALAGGVTIAATAAVAIFHGGEISGLQGTIEMAARGIALVVFGGVAGYSLALVTRHTVGAVGVVLGYLFLSFVRGIFGQTKIMQALTPWVPESNVLGFLQYGYSYTTYVETQNDDGTFAVETVEHALSFTHSSIYLGALLLVAVLGSLLIFKLRDVT